MKIAHIWLSVCLAGTVIGCGQKGPLVLPDTPRHKKVVPAPHPPAAPVLGAPTPAGTPATDAAGSPPNPPSKP